MPIEVSLDPDDWILADFSRGAISAFEPASEPASRRTTSLAQNRPNPVPSGAGTEIRFTLSRPSAVALRVFDVTGRLIQTLARGAHTAGDHAVIWDSRDAQGQVVADGAYFYQLVGPDGVEERRLVVVR